jgi:preprotein translocase subunit SecG
MQVLNIFHVLIAIAMIAFILIQKGAGATAGAAFGSGASGTVFGSRGAGNFLSHTTWVLATAFCLISLTMAVMASRMSLTPETDLGVVGSETTVEQSIENTASDLPLSMESAENSAENSDIPSMDAVLEQSAAEQSAAEQAATDVPAPEPAAEEETAAADDGS